MDDGIGGVQETSDTSVSSDDDGVKKRRESNAELAHDRAAEAQPDGSLGDPELGISFHTENEVREYYNRYAKAKGFGVTRRSSHRDDDGQLKYLTLCCSRYVAEIGALSDDSCNVLMEELRTLKIRFSSDSSSENGKENVATQEDASSNGKTTSKTIPSPIAVRCAGCPPSLRKESMLDKLICRANEKKKKAEQKAFSTNLNKKRSRKNRKSCEDDIIEQHAMEHASQQPVCLDDPGCNSRAQAPFNLGITTGDINPTVTATIPSGGSSTTVMPLIIGEYTAAQVVQRSSNDQSTQTVKEEEGSRRRQPPGYPAPWPAAPPPPPRTPDLSGMENRREGESLPEGSGREPMASEAERRRMAEQREQLLPFPRRGEPCVFAREVASWMDV
ncbi:hypothetical protein ZWY2020_050470 [Hordeum vulgare]|nr:hypothetical protein ZWY2020_050470 [Hordeum vulgare]